MEIWTWNYCAYFSSTITEQKMKFSVKDIFSKYDEILHFLRILSHLLKKSLMKNFVFCAVYITLTTIYMTKIYS